MHPRLQLIRGPLLATAILLSPIVSAQSAGNFPSRPVTIVLPFAPGGPSEREARLYATKLTELMGQPFVMDYKPGATGTIAAGHVARAQPDGHTLLVVTGSFTTLPAINDKLVFDPVRDFSPVSLMTKRTSVLIMSPGHPLKTFPEYIAYARANPGKINYATVGAGGIAHLAGAWMHSATDTKVTFVFYKGIAPLMADLIKGRVDITSSPLLSASKLIKAGKVRPLALMNDRPSPLLPELRSVASQGVPGFDYFAWFGIVAPGATPPAVVSRLSESLARTAKAPEVAAPLEAEGSSMVGSTPAEFGQLMVAEIANWKKVVRAAGIKLEK